LTSSSLLNGEAADTATLVNSALIFPQISTDIIVKIALSDEKYRLLYLHVAYEDRF